MKSMLYLVLFLFISVSSYAGDIIVGNTPPEQDTKVAKDTLSRSVPKIVPLSVNEFEVIAPDDKIKVPLLWHPINAEIIQKIDIAANTPFMIFMKRRGETEAKLHQFLPRPTAWSIIIGMKNGKSSFIIVRNGDNNSSPPVVIDTVTFNVGDANDEDVVRPNPVSPFLADLKKAMQLDSVAGINDKNVLSKLAGIYRLTARSDLSSIETHAELTSFLLQSSQTAGLPDAFKVNTNVRKRIQKELLDRQGIDDTVASDTKKIDRKVVKEIMSDIASTLEALIK